MLSIIAIFAQASIACRLRFPRDTLICMKRSLYQTLELYAKKKKTEEKALEALDAAETLEEFCANNMEAAERKAWDAAAAAAATAAAQNEKADHNEKPIKIGNGKEKEFVGHTSDWVD